MNTIKFKMVEIGQQFKYHPGAEGTDRRIMKEVANVRSGFVNAVGNSGIRSFVDGERMVWIEEETNDDASI